MIYFFLHLGILRELLYENDAPRYPNHHQVRFSIMSPGLHHEIWIPFIPPDEMTVERVLISVERVLQSDEKWLFAGTMRLTFVHGDLPVGNGRMKLSGGQLSHKSTDLLRRKRTIIQIPKDRYDMCCARAIVVGMAQLTPGISRTGKTSWGQQVDMSICYGPSETGKCFHVSGRDTCQQGVWTVRMGKVSACVGQYFSGDHVQGALQHHRVLRQWKRKKVRGRVVALYLADGHYHTIIRLPGFLGVGYMCPDCFGSSVAARHHRCKFKCKFWAGSGKCLWEGDGQLCQDCNVVYPSSSCMSRHVSTGVCSNRRSCSDCGKWYLTKLASGVAGQHRCGYSYCPVCHVMMPKGHKCYMQPAKTCKDEFKTQRYVFYDFESMLLQDGQHKLNLCVLHRVCTCCMDLPMEEEEEVSTPRCDCGRERKIFKREDTVEQFGSYLFTGRLTGCICIDHNSSCWPSYTVWVSNLNSW